MKRLLPLTLLFFLAPTVLAQNSVRVDFYYGPGCPHCARVLTSGLLDEVPNVTKKSLANEQNLMEYRNTIYRLGVKDGIPLAVIYCGDQVEYLQGDNPILNKLESQVQKCVNTGSLNGGQGLTETARMTNPRNELTFPVVITAAIIDSVNPCAFAVMIFLLSTILTLGSKKKIIKVGTIYVLTVYVTYLLSGMALFTAIQQVTEITFAIYYLAAFIAIIFGIINIKDFFWYGKGVTLRIPESKKSTIKKYARKATIPGAIVLGFLVSMFELPCTGGVYLAILSLIAKAGGQALPYLVLYNAIFVMPLVIILALAYVGVSTKKMEKWREGKRNWMKLFLGAFMVVLGIGMLLGWF